MKQKIQQLDDHALTDLIVSRQPGWRDTLSVLLQRHHSDLLKRCYNYLKNQEDAEDATQDTELRAFRAVHNFRGDASFRTWLFAIGDRQCFDLMRRRTRHIIDDHLRARIEIHENCNREITPAAETSTVVKKILSRLPEHERDVIVLRYYMELSLDEVSRTLGLGMSATKMRLYRALDKFSTFYRFSNDANLMNYHLY